MLICVIKLRFCDYSWRKCLFHRLLGSQRLVSGHSVDLNVKTVIWLVWVVFVRLRILMRTVFIQYFLM